MNFTKKMLTIFLKNTLNKQRPSFIKSLKYIKAFIEALMIDY